MYMPFRMFKAMAHADFASLNSSGTRIPFRAVRRLASAQVLSVTPHLVQVLLQRFLHLSG
jgi:hypothetical protein